MSDKKIQMFNELAEKKFKVKLNIFITFSFSRLPVRYPVCEDFIGPSTVSSTFR